MSQSNSKESQSTESKLKAKLSVESEQITTILAQDSESLDENSLRELLQAMENADGIAQGVEDKLDGILKVLDGLLGGLEGDNDKEIGVETKKEP